MLASQLESPRDDHTLPGTVLFFTSEKRIANGNKDQLDKSQHPEIKCEKQSFICLCLPESLVLTQIIDPSMEITTITIPTIATDIPGSL
jgi:hypothetical protein